MTSALIGYRGRLKHALDDGRYLCAFGPELELGPRNVGTAWQINMLNNEAA